MADVETIKTDSAYLAGDLPEQLSQAEDAFSKDATQLLKFHGIYQQDDRDVRKERQRAGLGRATSMMVRASIPGGVLDAEQYLAADALADHVSNGTLRITTRQGLQWHLVGKHDLTTLISTLNDHLITTLAACGDVVRNVCACPAPLPGRDRLLDHAAELAVAVRPRTSSYWDLWLDGERAVSAVPDDTTPAVPGDSGDATEPLYGATYLPRKFKIGFAHAGDNCIDVYTHDVGIVPQHGNSDAPPGGDDGSIVAYTLVVGGGLGMTHNKPATFPRLADPFATVTPDELVEVVQAIIAVQRDHGDRDDRKHARMKYLIEDQGLEWFRGEVESRLGRDLAPPGELTWEDTHDHLGWHAQTDTPDGDWFLGVPVPSGRIKDTDDVQLRSVVRDLVRDLGLGVRFTARQDLLLTDVPVDRRDEVADRLRAAGVPLVEDIPPVTRHALACPALPTCGLALAEAERAMPSVTSKLAGAVDELGLGDEELHLRVTGCPNGCSRPYSTEIGVIGRGKDHYTVNLGGDAVGARLNTPYADRVHLDDLTAVLTPLLAAWRDERTDGEGFGDWCDRIGPAELAARFPADAAVPA